MDKFRISDKEYDRICKGIIIGVFLGIIVGVLFENVSLFFSLGGVIGVLISTIYNTYTRHIIKNYNSNKEEFFK